MQNFDLVQRTRFYNFKYAKKYPDSTLSAYDHQITGMWMIGNDYRNASTYWGAYPHGYLTRMETLFPDAEKILHLFAGSLAPGNYIRFDCNPELGDVHGDAHQLSNYFAPASIDLCYADPPYSVDDADHYKTSMVNRNQVMRELAKVMCPGGYVVWLDQVLPIYSKEQFNLVGCIGLIRSTNHRFRVASIFKKV